MQRYRPDDGRGWTAAWARQAKVFDLGRTLADMEPNAAILADMAEMNKLAEEGWVGWEERLKYPTTWNFTKELSGLAPMEMLDPSIREDLKSIQDEIPKDMFGQDILHYLMTNEHNLDVWKDVVTDRAKGGIMYGVGSDQNFILAGWAKPEILILADFDMYVPMLHQVYAICFNLAATPDEFIELWSTKEKFDLVKATVKSVYADLVSPYQQGTERSEVEYMIAAMDYAGTFVHGTQRDSGAIAIVEPYMDDVDPVTKIEHMHRIEWPTPEYPRDPDRSIGNRLHEHFLKTKRHFEEIGVPCYLTDQEQYEFVANLFRSGRAYAVRGDLVGPGTMGQVGEFAKKHGMKVKVQYLSNCMNYFPLNAGNFRQNMINMECDEDDLVLHTDFCPDFRHYYYQSTGNFHRWLKSGASRRDMTTTGSPTDYLDSYEIKSDPTGVYVKGTTDH